MKKGKIIVSIVVLALIAAATIQPVLAYFTANTRAGGGYTIHQQSKTTIQEEFADWTKQITIENQEGEPVYVRAKAFAGSAYTLTYSGEGWMEGEDGWYYYSAPLAEGESTGSALNVKIGNVPKAEADAGFNVAVVYESTPVQYETDGRSYADWNMILDEGGEQG